MKKIIAIVAVLSIVAFGAGYVLAQDTAVTDAAKKEAVAGAKAYVCEACKVTMDMPGNCPVCGAVLMETAVTEEPATANEATVPDKN